MLFKTGPRGVWILVDEVSMISDQLLAEFECNLKSAARHTCFYKRRDKSIRAFGGYNVLFFGDWWQLPPIPDTAALFRPPEKQREKKQSEGAGQMVHLFWGDGADTINFLAELTVQKRVEDPWFNEVLLRCRHGALDPEHYCFLFGLPTLHAGSWYWGVVWRDFDAVGHVAQLQATGGACSFIFSNASALAIRQYFLAKIVHMTRTSLSSAGCCPCLGPWP